MQSENCKDCWVKLYSDARFEFIEQENNTTGTYYYKHPEDSIICLNEDLYYINNDTLFPLNNNLINGHFEWYFSKDKPRWTLRNENNSEDPLFYAKNATQIKSSVDSNIWNYCYKMDTSNFLLDLDGYYFLDKQPGESAGGKLYVATTFLALKNQKQP